MKSIIKLFSLCFLSVIITGCLHTTATVNGITSNFYENNKSCNDTYLILYDKQNLYQEKTLVQLLPILKEKNIIITDNYNNADYAIWFSYKSSDISYTTNETLPIYGTKSMEPYSYGIIGYHSYENFNLEFLHSLLIVGYKIDKTQGKISDTLWQTYSSIASDNSDFYNVIQELLLSIKDYITTDTQGDYRIAISNGKIISTKKK